MVSKTNPKIPTRKPAEDGLFYAYGEGGPDRAVASRCLDEAGAVFHATARTRFEDVEPNISVREGMDQYNWEFFRPGEHVPVRKNEVYRVADNIYRHNGIVKFVIDMMADFVTQGIQIYHPAKSKEARYRHWWKKVGGQQVSERLVNYLYRYGVAIVKRNFATLDRGDMEDLGRGYASAEGGGQLASTVRENKALIEQDVEYERTAKTRRNRIPLMYTFLCPTLVEVLGGQLSLFAGKPTFGLKIPNTLVELIKNAKTIEQKYVVSNLPSYISEAIGSGKELIPLDPEKVSVHWYKKDDWQLWADPLVMSIFKDLILFEKMKDADRAALDGCIRNVRLWRLGLPEHKIQPGPGAFKKLKEQLLASVGGSSMDLIWDASLDLKETSTDVYRFLGPEKYKAVMQCIFAGLGIPSSLAGGASGGMTTDALSIKTLIERLQYARNILVDFWEKEFVLIQRAFGDRQPAMLRFDMMSLSDEAAEKKLWLDLFDRNLSTMETTREKFGLLNDVENARQRREWRTFEAGELPLPVGPFTEAQPHPDQLLKAAMQQGTYTPSEAGAKPKAKRKGEKSLLDRQDDQQRQQVDLQKEQMAHEQQMAEREAEVKESQDQELHQQKLQQNDEVHRQRIKQKDVEHKQVTLPAKKKMADVKVKRAAEAPKAPVKGKPGQGRPQGAKDSNPRKRRTPKPRTSAELVAAQIRGRGSYMSVAEAVEPHYRRSLGLAGDDAMTAEEALGMERLTFALVTNGWHGWEESDGPPPAPTPEASDALAELTTAAFPDGSPTPDEFRELAISAHAMTA